MNGMRKVFGFYLLAFVGCFVFSHMSFAEQKLHAEQQVNESTKVEKARPVKVAADSFKGFYPESSEKIPAGVKRAARSVFRIAAIAYHPDHGFLLESWKQHENRMDSLGGEFLHRFLKTQEKHFREAKLPDCPVVAFGVGTGFLVGDGMTFVTVLHNFEHTPFADEWIKSAKASTANANKDQMTEFLRLLPPFVLFDGEGKIVFDSRRKEDHAEVAYMRTHPVDVWDTKSWIVDGADGKEADFDQLAEAIYGDIIVFKLNRKLGAGIPLATKLPSLAEEIYSVGFPGPTHDRKKAGFPDSDGFSRSVTVGKVIAPAALAKILGNANPPTSFLESTASNYLIGDQDSTGGISGGPFLNKQGEVLTLTGNVICRTNMGIHPATFKKMIELGPKGFERTKKP